MLDLSGRFHKMEAKFQSILGSNAIDLLRQNLSDLPVLTIGGDQLTGKSTLSKALAEYYGGTMLSAGTVFRTEASRRGITVAQLSRAAKETPEIDIAIDYNLCKLIVSGKPEDPSASGPVILEGRQPAVMATYLKTCLRRRNIVRLFLSCDVRHQALRFIKREVSEEAYQIAVALPHKHYHTLSEVGDDLKHLNIAGIEKVLEIFQDNAHRDRDDKLRYAEFYGFDDELNYTNHALYDIVIDTTHNTIAEVFDIAVKSLADANFSPNTPVNHAVAVELHAAHQAHHLVSRTSVESATKL